MGSIDKMYSNNCNIDLCMENDFSIVPPDTRIWHNKFPFNTGDSFPPEDIKQRANKCSTYDRLYDNEYEEAFSRAYNMKLMMNNINSMFGVNDVIANLPMFYESTEAWVDLLAGNSPYIDGDSSAIDDVSSIIKNSNFNTAFKSLVRKGLIMYGNSVLKVDRLNGGSVNISDIPIKNWIPFMNEENYNVLSANLFFNIIEDENYGYICEFRGYEENGDVLRCSYVYDKNTSKLGDIIEPLSYDRAFNGMGLSPIIVFTANSINNSIIGNSLYPKWEGAIAAVLRSFQNLLVSGDKLVDNTLVLPADAAQVSSTTDATSFVNKGTITYDNGADHDIFNVIPEIKTEELIGILKQSVNMLSRSTALSPAFFDGTIMGANMSAKALRTAMFSTELKATSIVNDLEMSVKSIVIRMAASHNLKLTPDNFNVVLNAGFVNDDEEKSKLIEARLGSETPTMTLEDALRAYDNIDSRLARVKANELLGIKNKEVYTNISTSSDGEVSVVVSDNEFTLTDNVDDKVGSCNQSNEPRVVVIPAI